MKIVKVTTITILLIATMVGGIKWIGQHDRDMQQAYEAYEACFLRVHGMLPSTWYATKGELPECKN